MKLTKIMYLINLIYILATSITFFLSSKPILVNLEGSYGHQEHGLKKIDNLNNQLYLTLTIVTGSWSNTELVSKYYSSFEHIKIINKTEMDFKIEGKVLALSQIFNTTFVKYECPIASNSRVCFASTSEVSIPSQLKSSILGINGLEEVLTLKPNFVFGKKLENFETIIQASTDYQFFLPLQVAQVYGFPISNGADVRVGIVSLGGYFAQSDLNDYFNLTGLGSAPNINIVLINVAQFNYSDVDSSIENYLDVEIIASLVPEANVTFYFAPNTFQYFYDAIKVALQNSDVVSISWGTYESETSSYWASFKALLAQYSNVPCFIATGDDGSSIGVGFPASCPNAIG